MINQQYSQTQASSEWALNLRVSLLIQDIIQNKCLLLIQWTHYHIGTLHPWLWADITERERERERERELREIFCVEVVIAGVSFKFELLCPLWLCLWDTEINCDASLTRQIRLLSRTCIYMASIFTFFLFIANVRESQRKAVPKIAQTTTQLHSSHTLVK